MSQKYYNDPNFLNTIMSVDLVLMNHLANMHFGGDLTRIIYSSNAYAFRKRSDKNNGNLNLPFINFKLTNIDLGDLITWHPKAYSSGIFIDEIDAKIRFAPSLLSYECSLWTHTDFDNKYSFINTTWDANNKTILKPSVTVASQEIYFAAHLGYTGLSFEPEYNETDWLEKNKIHSSSMDFEVGTFNLITNVDVSIPETLVFNFATAHDYGTDSYDDAREFVINHLTGEVEL